MAWVRFFGLLLICWILHTAESSLGVNASQKNYQFLELRGDSVVTSSGNLTSEGRVVLVMSGSRSVLDLQGASSITFPRERCLQNLDRCEKGFTVSVTFRTLFSPSDPKARVYVLDSGSDHSNVTGLTLYSESDRLTCVLAGTTQVWRLELQHRLVPAVWHQFHVSWHPVLGLTLWAGLHVLGSAVLGEPRFFGPVQDHRPLRFGSQDNAASTHLQVSGLSVMEVFVVDVLEGGLAGFSTIPTPRLPKLTTSHLATAAGKETSTTSPELNFRMIAVNFLMVSGQQVLTTQGTMATYGEVTLEPVSSGLVLVLDAPGEHVDMGYLLPCLRDVTSCQDGLNLRITFELLMTSPGHNILLSSGGDLLDSSGVTLSYFNHELIFIVKTNTSTWMGLCNITLQPGFWYTVDASWNGHGNGTLHVNNLEVPRRVYRVPHPPPSQAGHPLLLATSPGRQGSTLMKVFEVDVWAAHRESLRHEDLNLPSLPNKPPATFTMTLQSTEPTSNGVDLQSLTQPASSERFQDKNDVGADDDKVVVVALGTLCALLSLAAVVGGLIVCWRSRRCRAKQRLQSRHNHSQAALSVDYAFLARPRAYHNHIYSSAESRMMY